MANETDPVMLLEELRDLITSSIEVIKRSAEENHDPAISLSALYPHPLHNRSDAALGSALKTVAASAQMLRALCDPKTFTNDIIYGYHDETALFVCCKANVASILGNKECHIDEIAAKAGINSDKLARYLRNLCNIHIFQEVAPDIFANNALSIQFKEETKKALVGHCADECRVASCKTWEFLTLPEYKDSTDANKAPFNIAYDTPLNIFQWYAEARPDIGQRAKLAMAGKGLNLGQYLSVYPWKEEGNATIVDVGGGVGGATLPILEHYPELKLLIQDLPDTKIKFEENLEENFPGVYQSGRAAFIAHDFFKKQPIKGAAIYFLRHVIHDWPDKDAISILAECAASMSTDSKLLICEHIIFPTYRTEKENLGLDSDHLVIAPRPLLANWGAGPTSRLDLQVLTCLNAKQRTEVEFRDLCSKAGLRVVKVWRNLGDEAIVQCQLQG